MLSAGHTGHMLRDIGQRLDTQSCGWEQCEKYMPCVKHWVQRTVEECQVPQCPLHLIQIRTVPSLSVCGLREASYPKYLGTVVVGLEPRGGQGEAALTAGPPLAPTWVKLQSLDCCSRGPSPHPCSFPPCVRGVGGSY